MLTRLLSLPTALRSLATLVALTVLAGTVSACGSNDEPVADDAPIEEVGYVIGDPIADPAIAAIVTSDLGSDTLTTEDFRNQFEIIAMQVPQLRDDEERSRELRKNLVEDFVLTHALHGESERLGVSIESSEVLQRLDQIKSRFPSEVEYRQALDADDLTEEELIENLGDMMRQEQTLNRMAESAPEPTEAETQEFRESQA
jgi:peptidyl-prolyl cis-trans isomerase C